MKKHLPILFALLLSCVWIVSCSDDDGESDELSIVGEWNVQSSNIDFTIDGGTFAEFLATSLGITVEEAQSFIDEFFVLDEDVFEEMTTITFNSDGTYTSVDPTETTDGTWSINADNTIITFDQGTSDEVDAEVLSLTASQLSIQLTEEETDDFDEDGDSEVLSITIQVDLTR